MGRASVAGIAVLCAVLFAGCKEEPTIVIKFEPNDLSSVAKAADLGVRRDLATAAPDLGGTTIKTAHGPSSKKPAECRVASDCVLEPADCCDCANGGKQHAIPKKLAAESKAAREQRCKNIACTMMMSTDPSCGQRADCVDGVCVMAKK